MSATILAIDTGGTFTDFVLFQNGQLHTHKVLSTPAAPEQAILQGVDDLQLMDAIHRGKVRIIHGTTIATNAALEGKGVKTAFVTNRGFKDMLNIGRQARPQLYALQQTPQIAPVADNLCLETGGRIDTCGNTLEALTAEDIETLLERIKQQSPQAVAINLLFSWLDPGFEQQLEQALSELDLFCCRSSYVLPQTGEYERGIATWLNASLSPLVQQYLLSLQTAFSPSHLTIMQSSGGTISAEQAGQRGVNLLLSGPAGGLRGSEFLGTLTGQQQLLTFDMGGTSTDVALVNGGVTLTDQGQLAGYPIAVPMVEMHTIGAGGGSIAYCDEGGLLQVGPRSAGASPGPACYGNGGTEPTVTDANAVLGRLPAEHFLGGTMTLDRVAAQRAVERLAIKLGMSIEETATGIVDLANEHMTQALRVISIERGHDPKDYTLCCFGGAGGLHLCALADALQMQRAVVPLNGGVFSAFGMLVAPREIQLTHTCRLALETSQEGRINREIAQLAATGIEQLEAGGVEHSAIITHASLDLRYAGQSFTLNIDWRKSAEQAKEDFHEAHRQRYGHALPLPVELLNVRLASSADNPPLQLPNWPQGEVLSATQQHPVIYERDRLVRHQCIDGPALICEQTSTTYVAPHWQACVDGWGNLQLKRDC